MTQVQQLKEKLEQVKFLMPRQPLTNFEIQKSYEMNLNFMVFIQERVYLKSRMYNKYIKIYIYI